VGYYYPQKAVESTKSLREQSESLTSLTESDYALLIAPCVLAKTNRHYTDFSILTLAS